MDKEYTFPKPPVHLQIPSNHVYLGTNKDVPTLEGRRNYTSYYADGKVIERIKYKGSLGVDHANHYSVEFGSPEWNRWASVKFDLQDIPDDYVWIGGGPLNKGVVNDEFWGSYLYKNEWYYIEEPFFFHFSGHLNSTQYIIRKDDPQYGNAKKYFTSLYKDTNNIDKVPDYCTDPVLVELDNKHQELVKAYQKAKEELQEAKENGWTIRSSEWGGLYYLGNTYSISDETHVSINNLSTIVINNLGHLPSHPWSMVEIIKEEPAPSFEVNGYKPEFQTYCWKFGCAKISHQLVDGLVAHHKDMGESCDEYKGLTSVTIGAGTFTMDQLIELSNYRKNLHV